MMKSSMYSTRMLKLLSVWLLCGLMVANVGWAGAESSGKYGYFYKNEFVELVPSSKYVALAGNVPSMQSKAADSGLVRDPLSDRHPVKSRGLGIYRLPAAETKTKSRADVSARIPQLLERDLGYVQPVFEQGGAILIPSDEVIIGFKAPTSLEEAEAFLSPYWSSHGIAEVKAFRKNTFIIRINDPSDGRIYAVAQFFALIEEIRYAEPNHIVVMRRGSELIEPKSRRPQGIEFKGGHSTSYQQAQGNPSSNDERIASPVWITLAAADFESPFLPNGWAVGAFDDPSVTDAYWGQTSYRSRSGSFSAYCAAAGTAAVTAPGPAQNDMFAIMQSPLLDLAGYEEVYIELWFYAPNEMGFIQGVQLYDYPELYVVHNPTGNYANKVLVTLADGGDCTLDPTTHNGWRRLLYRVPPAMRLDDVFLELDFYSDSADQTEGTYIDDIRIVATTDVDAQPLGNDPYGGRQYELRNLGQVAGLGNDDNDLHLPEAWALTPVSSDVVVAVIDDGVELAHPDLNLVQGYNYDGTLGGGPPGTGESHGTACAGNVGAKMNNNAGVIGTAPGVKIMPVYSGGTESSLASSIDEAVLHGADILSNSWGWVGAPVFAIEQAIDDALAAGVAVLFAAGNGPDRDPWTYDVAFPGNLTATKNIVTVGASSLTDEHKAAASSDGEFSWGSSYVGDGPDVVSPGPWSYTTDRLGANGYNDGSILSDANYTPTFGGTSSSTPKVAGIVALMLSANPNLTPAQVKQILRSTADDIDAQGVDDKTGAGRVNAYEAVRTAQQMVGGIWPVSIYLLNLLQ